MSAAAAASATSFTRICPSPSPSLSNSQSLENSIQRVEFAGKGALKVTLDHQVTIRYDGNVGAMYAVRHMLSSTPTSEMEAAARATPTQMTAPASLSGTSS